MNKAIRGSWNTHTHTNLLTKRRLMKEGGREREWGERKKIEKVKQTQCEEDIKKEERQEESLKLTLEGR